MLAWQQRPLLVNGWVNLCCSKNESRLRNEEIQLFDEVFSSRYAKDYLKRITGRLQTSEETTGVSCTGQSSEEDRYGGQTKCRR
jgi:hypothetical protein